MSEIMENMDVTPIEPETGIEATPNLGDLASSESGTDMLIGGGAGMAAGGVIGFKWGESHTIKKLRSALEKQGMKPAEIELIVADVQGKVKKPKTKLKFRNPFYREEVTPVDQKKNEVTGDKPETGSEVKKEEKNSKKNK